IGESVTVGAVFSILLVLTTRYEEKDSALYVKQSRLFPLILVTLLALRIILKSILSMSISPGEIGGMFFLLAFVMIVIWRLSMYFHLRAFKKQQISSFRSAAYFFCLLKYRELLFFIIRILEQVCVWRIIYLQLIELFLHEFMVPFRRGNDISHHYMVQGDLL